MSSQASPCRIHGKKGGTGAGFFLLAFPLSHFSIISLSLHKGKGKDAPLYGHRGSVQAVGPIGGVYV